MSWDISGGITFLHWKETGGPAAIRPQRLGLGLQMIKSGLQSHIGGQTNFEWGDAATSMARIAIGFLIGSAIGALLGLVIGTFRLAREILEPYVNFLRFISGVAWISELA